VSIEPEVKYEGFGGGPLLVGAWGSGPLPPLNPALKRNIHAAGLHSSDTAND